MQRNHASVACRRIRWLAAFALAMASTPLTVGVAQGASPRVVVVMAEGVSPDDWLKEGRLAGQGRAIVSTRTGVRMGYGSASEAAVATMLHGVRSGSLGREVPALIRAAADSGLAPTVIHSGGVPWGIDGFHEVTLVPGASLEETVGEATGAIGRSRLVFISLGLIDASSLDRTADRIQRVLGPGDTSMVLSLVPTEADFDDRVWLGAMRMTGPSIHEGTLTSPTTGIDGLVSLLDVAPTLGAILNLAMEGDGHPIRGTGTDADLISMTQGFRHSTRSRHVMTRASIWFCIVAAALGVSLLKAWPDRTWPVRLLGGSMVGLPLGMILEPLVGSTSTAVSMLFVAAVSGLCALATVARGSSALMWICLITVGVILGDIALGQRLARFSVLSFSPAQGDRFRGIGNELMGVTIACVIVTSAIMAWRMPTRWHFRVLPLMVGSLSVMGAPGLGTKLGAVLTGVPAFVAAAFMLSRRRMTLGRWVAVAGVMLMAGVVLVVADQIRTPSHISEAASGSGIVAVVTRKMGAAARILVHSIWPRALASLILVAFLGGRYVQRVRELFSIEPYRAGAKATLIAMAAALAFNDAGAIAGALIASISVGALLVLAAPGPSWRPRSVDG